MENVTQEVWDNIDLRGHKSCIEKINNGTMTWEDTIKYKDEPLEHWQIKSIVNRK